MDEVDQAVETEIICQTITWVVETTRMHGVGTAATKVTTTVIWTCRICKRLV